MQEKGSAACGSDMKWKFTFKNGVMDCKWYNLNLHRFMQFSFSALFTMCMQERDMLHVAC